MGIGMVLFVYFTALSALALVSSIVLGAGVGLYLRRISGSKWRIIVTAAVFPFACVGFAGVWFFVYAAVSAFVFHHDPMIGDGWYTNIGNGYAIDMIDVTDQGIVHPTSGESNGLNNPDGIRGVRRLQIEPPFLYVSQDSDAFNHLGRNSEAEDNFLAVDMRDHVKTTSSSEQALKAYVNGHGQQLHLEPLLTVYRRQRSVGFDLFASAILLAVPTFAFWRLLRAVYRLRAAASVRVYRQSLKEL